MESISITFNKNLQNNAYKRGNQLVLPFPLANAPVPTLVGELNQVYVSMSRLLSDDALFKRRYLVRVYVVKGRTLLANPI